jgi:hypothetical protein
VHIYDIAAKHHLCWCLGSAFGNVESIAGVADSHDTNISLSTFVSVVDRDHIVIHDRGQRHARNNFVDWSRVAFEDVPQ